MRVRVRMRVRAGVGIGRRDGGEVRGGSGHLDGRRALWPCHHEGHARIARLGHLLG